VLWTNDPTRSLQPIPTFKRYAIPVPMAKSINDCLAISLKKVSLGKPTQTTPEAAIKRCKIDTRR
jgi:hypothetical protein